MEEERTISNDAAPPDTFLNILLAEDNIINQKLVKVILDKRGHRVTIANDGIEVVSAISRQRFDVILMDVQMPELDGYETTQLIRNASGGKFDPQIPIIAMTSYATKGDMEKCLQAGMNDYICKPVDVQELKRALDRVAIRDKKAGQGAATAAVGQKEAADHCPVDLSRLRKIYKTEEQIHEILELYIETAGPLLSTIPDVLIRKDYKMFFYAIHKLKGASGNIGAAGIAQLCLQVEESAEVPDWEELSTLYENILGGFEMVKRFVKLHQ